MLKKQPFCGLLSSYSYVEKRPKNGYIHTRC
jgi:hypothetical protein